ncbi:MAG TPA: hypothetical protein VHF22_15380 [Planctomycetota bacterium]|nr:hypothetical protein [Planctomycetota bacterium]
MIHLVRSRLAADFWDLISHFFEAQRQFRETYDTYETKVLQYAEERGVDRRFLRLSAEEVSGLLDFRKLEALRNGELQVLKTISHKIFRSEDATDPFDRYVSQVFHELSILKEEQYKVSTFAPEYMKRAEKAEYESILDEVHEAFPRQVHGIYDLFQKAQARLEELLPNFAREWRSPRGRVTVRSIYLFGDDAFRGFYPNTIEDVYEIVYQGGAMEGYLTVAKSFLESGFRAHAVEALEKALRAAPPELPALEPDGESESAGVSAHLEASRREAEELLRELKDGTRRKRPPRGGAGTETL